MENVNTEKRNTIKSNFSKKRNALWNDKRSYKKRLFIAIAPVFAMCYTFLFFGPVEMTAFSHDSLSFSFTEITPIMAFVSISAFVLITLIVSILRGKIFNYVVTAIFSFTICGYLQGNFFNGELGALTGDAIAWQDQKTGMLWNLLIWFILFMIPYTLLYFNRKLWKQATTAISVVLILMQTVALGSIFISADTYAVEGKNANFLSNKEMYSYSKKDNTFVFLLDRLDYDYIEQVMVKDPDFFKKLDGFTSYTNAISENARTKPAANYMLTNCDKYLFKTSPKDYFEKSWENGNVLKDLSKAGYVVDMYTEISDMFGQGKSMKKYISNMTSEHSKINTANIVNNLLTLSGYRYGPTSLKPFYWAYTDDINKGAYKKGKPEQEVYEIDEAKFARGIKNIKVTDDRYFKFYHFNGSHTPYTLNENGKRNAKPTSVVEQTKGSFQILYETFTKMKELGIYKDATIIITADHGSSVSDKKPLQKATRIGLFYKPSGSEGTALKNSKAPVSFKNIPATILKESGINYTNYGTPLDEVKDDSTIVRNYYKTVMVDGKEKELYSYEIKGDASDFKNWHLKKTDAITAPFY